LVGRPDVVYNRHLEKTRALNERHLSDTLNIEFKVNYYDGHVLFLTIFQKLQYLRESGEDENEDENENENVGEDEDNNANAHTRSLENRLESFDRSGPASAFRAHRMHMPVTVHCRRSCWRQTPPALTL